MLELRKLHRAAVADRGEREQRRPLQLGALAAKAELLEADLAGASAAGAVGAAAAVRQRGHRRVEGEDRAVRARRHVRLRILFFAILDGKTNLLCRKNFSYIHST